CGKLLRSVAPLLMHRCCLVLFIFKTPSTTAPYALSLHDALPISASGGIQGDVLATDNNTVGMGDAGIKSAIQGSNVPNPCLQYRSEERFSRNAETDLVCRLLLEKKNRLGLPGRRRLHALTGVCHV